MGLNIKNKEAHELANELAELTGKSMTAVVIDALRKQLDSFQHKKKAEYRIQELMEIGRRCAEHIHQPARSTDHGDMLYDKFGLPK